jgi:hypothetical protein
VSDALRGLRTFLVDLAMVIGLGAVAILVALKDPSSGPELLIQLGIGYGAIAAKGYAGKKRAGDVELAKGAQAAARIETDGGGK